MVLAYNACFLEPGKNHMKIVEDLHRKKHMIYIHYIQQTTNNTTDVDFYLILCYKGTFWHFCILKTPTYLGKYVPFDFSARPHCTHGHITGLPGTTGCRLQAVNIRSFHSA